MTTVEADKFHSWWQTEFGVCPPVGYRLRTAFPHRWVRFHSLPDGKRYAETPEEAAEVLRRHNVVAGALLGDGEPIVIVCTGYSDREEPVLPEGHRAVPGWLQLAHTVVIPSYDDDLPGYWHFWTASTRWRPGRFDELLMGVARDEIRNILLVQPDRRAVYHPYDGGADVIGADIFVCDSLRRDFRNWLSAHPSGL